MYPNSLYFGLEVVPIGVLWYTIWVHGPFGIILWHLSTFIGTPFMPKPIRYCRHMEPEGVGPQLYIRIELSKVEPMGP